MTTLAQTREKIQIDEMTLDRVAVAIGSAGSFLFQHNAKIGFLCFALGFALGVPVIYLLMSNGLMLGSFLALDWGPDHGPW